MIGLVIHWNGHEMLKVKGGAKRWLSFYVFTCQSFGVTDLILIGGPEIPQGYDINFKQYERIEDALKDDPKHKHIALMGGGKPLKDFKHPKKDCLYIVGDDYSEVNLDKLTKPQTVSIPGVSHLWGHVAAGIVLHHRYGG